MSDVVQWRRSICNKWSIYLFHCLSAQSIFFCCTKYELNSEIKRIPNLFFFMELFSELQIMSLKETIDPYY